MMVWRLALALFPELAQLARYILAAVFGLLFVVAVSVGMHAQPWSPWWFAGSTQAPAGVVPEAAAQAPQGPIRHESGDLMAAIQPWMGTRYVFGGCALSGVDCSCFTQNVARTLGMSLPRTAQLQWNATERVSSPEFGDLVFFERTYSSHERITHVGWYVGDGWMISAIEPTLGRQSLNSPFWRSHFAGYGRIRRAIPNQA